MVWFGSSVQFFWPVPWIFYLGSHRPSNSATLVPLEEWNYNLTGKCYLFGQLHVLKVILGTLSWCALVVSKLVRLLATLQLMDPVSEQQGLQPLRGN